MSKAYLITFTPIYRFFFGGSYSLEDSFYAESLKFPQPTTILGCLRNTILAQADIISPTTIIGSFSEEAQKLTGTSTLNRLDDTNVDFGAIERLSPVFIVKFKDNAIEDFLFPVPADIMKDGSSLIRFGYEKKTNGKSSYSGRVVEYAILSKRNPKLREFGYLGGKDFWEEYMHGNSLPHNPYYEEDKIFIAHTSIGIGRKNRVAEEGMFYTKIDYSLRKGFAFAVIAWLKEDSILKDDVVILGGEQSTFLMKVSSLEDISHPVINMIVNNKCNMSENLSSCSNEEKIIALSPIVLDKGSNDRFASTMEHRIVKGMQATRIVKRAKALKSEAISMIPAGSVFYPKEPVSLTVNWKISYKIGYNYVIKIRRQICLNTKCT